MSTVLRSPPRPSGGFSLIELMITVAIIGILASIALPAYSEYIQRGRLTDGQTRLADLRIQMEKYFQDNRTYLNGAVCGVDPLLANYNLDGSRSFDFTCPAGALTATTYQLVATGRATKNMSGFTFTVDQNNAKTSSGPSGWTSATCWFVRKDGSCS